MIEIRPLFQDRYVWFLTWYIASCLSHFKGEIKDVLLDRIEHEYLISNSYLRNIFDLK